MKIIKFEVEVKVNPYRDLDYSGYQKKPNLIIVLLYSERKTPKNFVSSLTASNTNSANLTWLPLEIMHRGHTYSYPGGGGVTPYNGLYGEAPPERGTFFKLQV